jgi:hypothetical protein
VKDDDHSGQRDLVIKFSWPEDTRVNEADMIFEAHKRLSSHEDPEIQKLTRHLPDLYFTYNAPQTSTSIIREQFGIPDAKKGARSLRGLVFGRLEPITNYVVLPMSISSGAVFWKVFWQCFLGTYTDKPALYKC